MQCTCGCSIAPMKRVGCLPAALLQRRVRRGDHEVQFGQHVGLEVQATVLEDVDLHTGEHGDVVVSPARLADRRGVFGQAILIQAVRLDLALGMLGNAEVPVAAPAAGLDHLLDGVRTVRGGRVHVQVAADVARLKQGGQVVGPGGLDLSAVLAQLRRDQRSPSFA